MKICGSIRTNQDAVVCAKAYRDFDILTKSFRRAPAIYFLAEVDLRTKILILSCRREEPFRERAHATRIGRGSLTSEAFSIRDVNYSTAVAGRLTIRVELDPGNLAGLANEAALAPNALDV